MDTCQQGTGGRKVITMTETHDEKMYNLICKERFDHIDKQQQQVIDLLRGKNGDAGLLDEVRTLKKRWTTIFAAIAVLGTAAIGQAVHWFIGLFE